MALTLAWDSKTRKEKAQGTYQRERSADPYHSYRWTRLSRVFRAEHPLCAECLKAGRFSPAEVVDHIIPWPVCQDFFERSNLQSLCQQHNIEKGNKDKKLIAKWRKEHQNQ